MFGTWHKFKDVRPSSMDPKPLSYLVIIEGCSEPCTGYYDFSRSDSVSIPRISGVACKFP